MKIVTSWMEEGIKEGFEQGRRNLLLRMLEKKLGKFVPELRQQLESLSSEQVDQLGDIFFELESMDDLAQWVRDNGNDGVARSSSDYKL